MDEIRKQINGNDHVIIKVEQLKQGRRDSEIPKKGRVAHALLSATWMKRMIKKTLGRKGCDSFNVTKAF